MIQVQIQQFLDKAGCQAFAGWLRFFAKVTRQFDGFVNVQVLQVEGGNSLNMVVIFENRDKLDRFLSSPVFEQMMRRMDKHATQPYQKMIYRSRNIYDYRKLADEKAIENTSQLIKATPDNMQSKVTREVATVPDAGKPVPKAKAPPPPAAEAKPEPSKKIVGMANYKKNQVI